MASLLTRRTLLLGLAAPAVLAGVGAFAAVPDFRKLVLGSGSRISHRVHAALGGNALAREYDASQISPKFRLNGNTQPQSADYARHEAEGFANWRLQVSGLVAKPMALSLADLRARPVREQITMHNCVEGWSAIGGWTGTMLGPILDEAGLSPDARFIVFRCADTFGSTPYYESIDLRDAFHPQTILAWGMNGDDLTVGHGAPLRLRVERQLGYKQAKYVMAVETVASLDSIGAGRGGYWEDAGGYDWYAGI